MSKNSRKNVHILSLDGGGSRGIMEVILLDHIMNLTTVMVKNPEHIITLLDKVNIPDMHSFTKYILNHIEGDPIHPTDAFQYIVGKFLELNTYT